MKAIQGRFVETDWNDVVSDAFSKKLYFARCAIMKENALRFLKVVSAYYQVKPDLESLRVFENVKANMPVLLCYSGMGYFIAPIIEENEKYSFEDYKE